MLDPTWQSPYAPSNDERHANQLAVRQFAVRRQIPGAAVAGVLVLALIVGVVVVPWMPVLGVALGVGYVWYLRRSLVRFEHQGSNLGDQLLATFKAGGTPKDRQRLVTVLDRLAATFGVDTVNALIVDDPGYNAALVPTGTGYSLFVTSAVMSDFELIELEGLVAHCLARHRLGQLTRQAVTCTSNLSETASRQLVGEGFAYRADEVAAAAIRYPLGLAGALHKCARQGPVAGSFFTSAQFAKWRWVWCNVWADRATADLAQLDDAELRALALEEW